MKSTWLLLLCFRDILRHGVRQLGNPWADGPEYVTQCPIRPGGSYTYRFTIQKQEGTLWWHAHSKWLRATVYGAIIIYPRLGKPYPFPVPKREFPLLLGTRLYVGWHVLAQLQAQSFCCNSEFIEMRTSLFDCWNWNRRMVGDEPHGRAEASNFHRCRSQCLRRIHHKWPTWRSLPLLQQRLFIYCTLTLSNPCSEEWRHIQF